jgi:hypothetical protein
MARKAPEIKRPTLLGEGGISVGMSGIFPEYSLLFVAIDTTGNADNLIFLQCKPKSGIILLQACAPVSIECIDTFVYFLNYGTDAIF